MARDTTNIHVNQPIDSYELMYVGPRRCHAGLSALEIVLDSRLGRSTVFERALAEPTRTDNWLHKIDSFALSAAHCIFVIQGAVMWQRRKTFSGLHEELKTIAMFDRVHDYARDPDPAADRAHSIRQARRAQILSEIEKLRTSKPHRSQTRVSSAIVLLCAVGCATLYYLLK